MPKYVDLDRIKRNIIASFAQQAFLPLNERIETGRVQTSNGT